MSRLSQTQLRILELLSQYEHLTITQIKETLGLKTPPYNDISSLQNGGCLQQLMHEEAINYQLTSGGEFVLKEHQEQLQRA